MCFDILSIHFYQFKDSSLIIFKINIFSGFYVRLFEESQIHQ